MHFLWIFLKDVVHPYLRYLRKTHYVSFDMEIWAISSFWFFLMYYTNCMCYSNFNFGWIVYVLVFQRKNMISFVTCNHVATVIHRYVSCIIDRSIRNRMITKYGWNVWQFVVGDIILHVLPTFAVIYMNCNWKDNKQLQFPGIYSFLLHLIWAVVLKPSFDVIKVYIPMSVHMYSLLWFVLVMSHSATLEYQ